MIYLIYNYGQKNRRSSFMPTEAENRPDAPEEVIIRDVKRRFRSLIK